MHGNNFEKPKNIKITMKKLFNSLKEYKVAILFAIIFTIGSTIFMVVGPKILGNATTEIFKGVSSKLTGGVGIDFEKVGGILLTLGGLYLLSSIFSYIENILMVNVSQKLTYNLRKKIIAKINKMPFGYFDKKSYGETLSVLVNDTDTINNGIMQSATTLISAVVTIIGVFVMMLTINVFMTLITVILIPVSFVLVGFIVKKSQGYFLQNQKSLADVNGKIEEMFAGQRVIKVFNNEDSMIETFEEDNKKLYDANWKSQFISSLMHPIISFIGNIGYVVNAILGGYFAIKGVITIGNIQSFIQYTKNFTQPINQLAQISSMIQSLMAASERVFNFLEEEEEHFSDKAVNLNDIKGNVEFKNVKFGYDEDMIIKDFSAKVKNGQKIAIVGPTGAGKTTIVKLLMNFYKVNSGSITLDGYNINEYSRDKFKNVFGMVLQDTWLFSGTILENIRYGNLEASDEEVVKAAKIANVDHFVRSLPDGYNMELNEDSDNISLGQKQLLTIARAVLANPKILILDEATSSVDTRTEVLIQSAMDKLMEGRTSFIIAHRLSTIKNADLILVMEQGNIVEVGTHDELLNKKGFYEKLYNSQFDEPMYED